MSSILWAMIGMAIGAAVLHCALGLTRPLNRTYLSFASIMALLAAYVYFEWELYRAATGVEAGEALRHQVIAAHGCVAFILVFVPSYTKVHVPRRIMTAYWAGLAVFFVANVALPYGIWCAREPSIVFSSFRGEPFTVVDPPPLGPWQYIHTLYMVAVFALTFTCALALVRRGERQRGAMLAIALVVVIVHHLIDVFRDTVGGTWPYVAELGLVTWGLLMSIQLAIDFRVTEQELHVTLRRAEQHTAELANLVEATLLVRDKLNTPLQTLELGLAMREATEADDEKTLSRLRHAVAELAELGRMVEHEAVHSRDAAQEQAA